MLLNSAQSLGQTFTARQAGLNGLELWLVPDAGGEGIIHLELFDNPIDRNQLSKASLPASQVSQAGWHRIFFSPAPALPDRDYFLSITYTGTGSVRLGNAAGASYLNGSAYINGKAAPDQQLAFNLLYQPRALTIGLLREGLDWTVWLFLAVLLFIVPGWGLLSAAWPGWDSLGWIVKLGLGIGVSLALYPILILWTGVVGLHLGPVYAWLPFLAALAWLVWKNRAFFLAQTAKDAKNAKKSILSGLQSVSSLLKLSIHWPRPFNWPDAAFIVVVVLIAGTRFYIARVIPAPLWADSIHHTAITQLLVDHGGLFSSWQPYFDIESLGYHFGFHSAAAVFHWMSGLSVPQSVLWGGQLINILSVIALYPLAVKLGGNRWAGVAAVLAGGLVGVLPNFYINWATYTLLAGHTILAALLWMAWTTFEKDRSGIKALTLTGIMMAGLALTHYRVLVYAVLFLLVGFLASLRKRKWTSSLKSVIWIGLIGGLLFLPWFIHLLPTGYMALFNKRITTSVGEIDPYTLIYNNTTGPLTSFLPVVLWVLMVLAALWGLWRRERLVAVLLVWIGMIAIAANPDWVGLPGTGLLKNFSVLTGIYLPAAVLTGAGAGWLVQQFNVDGRWWRGGLVALAVFALAIWGARQRLGDLQPENFTFMTRPDLRAFKWIEDNTPAGSLFLVNSHFTYGGTTITGSDGGWWLPLLAGRRVTQPAIPYTTETSNRPDFTNWTNALPALVRQKGPDSPEVLSELRARQVSYVYIGQRQGLAGNWTDPPMLDPASLLGSSNYSLLYHQDRVYIFGLKK